MNQNLKRIVVWILLASLLLGLVPAVALSAFAEEPGESDDPPAHTHQSGDSWSTDSEKHWHTCIAEGCAEPAERLDEADHDFSEQVCSEAFSAGENTYFYSCKCGRAGTETFHAYTVSFDIKGHGADIASKTVIEGNTVSEPSVSDISPSASEPGWRFKGWKNGEADWSFSTPIEADTVLTAQWEMVYAVSIDESAEAFLSVDSEVAAPGEEVTIKVNVPTGRTLSDLTVMRGSTSVEHTDYKFIMPEGNVTISGETILSAITLDTTRVPLLYVGDTKTVSVQSPAGEAVTWESDNEEVCKVSTSGEVAAVAPGDAVITAAAVADPTITASCTVHVGTVSLTAADATVDGKVNMDLASGCTLTLTLTEGTLAAQTGTGDASNYKKSAVSIANAPTGVTWAVERKSDTQIQLTFTGKPTQEKSDALQISVAKALINNVPASAPAMITVKENAAAKWDIRPSYTVTGAATAKGNVNIPNPGRYAEGDTVIFTPTANAPYTITGASYTLGSGDPVEIAKSGNGYSFTMPAGDVSVNLTFKVATLSSAFASKTYVRSFSIPNHSALFTAIKNGSSSVKTDSAMTQDQKDAITNGGSYNFLLTAQESTNTTDNNKLKAQAITKDKCKPTHSASGDATYLDLTLSLRIYDADGAQVGENIAITDTGSNKVTVIFNANRTPANRLYYVHTGHSISSYLSQASSSTNGNVSFTNLTQFSTYLLAKTTTSTPSTGDHFPMEALLAVFCLSAMSVGVLLSRRKFFV